MAIKNPEITRKDQISIILSIFTPDAFEKPIFMNTESPEAPVPNPHTPSATDVVAIVAKLRGPEGCPWDREQTTQSLKPFLLEEVYEVLEAIDTNDPSALKEELGDLLLQILFHSQIAEEQGHFSYQEVKTNLGEKLIRRHPHVFQKHKHQSPTTSGQVVSQWEQLKQQEKVQQEGPSSVLASIPKASPALQRAFLVQKRASKVGFDWNTIEPVLYKLKEELDELYGATTRTSKSLNRFQMSLTTKQSDLHIEEELGDVLFSLVNISRFLQINPEEALRKATNKFVARFHYIESQATKHGKPLNDFPLEKLDEWWEAAKRQESAASSQIRSSHHPTP